jgi:hypothetical protein
MRAVLLCLLVASACRTSALGSDDLAGADLAGRDLALVGDHDLAIVMAKNHRPDDSQCSTARGTGNCEILFTGPPCQVDSMCTMGTAGRCEQNNGGPGGCHCSYDTCQHDGDCGSGMLCACHGSAYNTSGGNTCLPGNCRVDADCGDRACSPTVAMMGCGGVVGYYCHVAADECTNDDDCRESTNVCLFDHSAAHWKCGEQLACP